MPGASASESQAAAALSQMQPGSELYELQLKHLQHMMSLRQEEAMLEQERKVKLLLRRALLLLWLLVLVLLLKLLLLLLLY